MEALIGGVQMEHMLGDGQMNSGISKLGQLLKLFMTQKLDALLKFMMTDQVSDGAKTVLVRGQTNLVTQKYLKPLLKRYAQMGQSFTPIQMEQLKS